MAGEPQRVDAREVVVDRRVAEARVPAAVIGRGQQDDGQSRSAAASATASAIAFGSSYGVPSGWWWT